MHLKSEYWIDVLLTQLCSVAFCALVDHYAPGSIDVAALSPSDGKANCELGILALLMKI